MNNNNKKPMITVIIPTYKRSDMIEKSIESVLNQTYSNIEIIVIDDNEKTSNYRRDTKFKLKRFIDTGLIKYLENEHNLGGSLARNRGIEASNGEYIAFLDDDDIFYPTKLEKQMNLFFKSDFKNLGLIYCHSQGVDEDNNILWTNTNSYKGLPLYESMTKCIASSSMLLCKKDMLLKIGGFEDMPSKQDLLLMVKIIANGYKIDCVEEILVDYLEHNQGKISSSKAKPSIAKGYEILRDFSRVHYEKLEKIQRKNVEYKFSRTLSLQYIYLNNDMFFKEWLSLVRIYPHFILKNGRILIKKIFSNLRNNHYEKKFEL